MKHYFILPLVTSALVGLLALPPVISASAGTKKEVIERESVDVEHRTTHEHGDIKHEHHTILSRERKGHPRVREKVRKVHRKIHRELEEHHHDD